MWAPQHLPRGRSRAIPPGRLRWLPESTPPPSQDPPPPHYCDYVKCIRLPESTSPSQNIPPFQQIYATLPEYTLSSQNIPPFSTIICDPPKIYPSVPEYRPYPPFQQLYATLPESTLPPPSKNIPPFSTTICDPPRFYPSLPECTPLFNNYMRPSQNLLIPPRIYPNFQQLQDYATPPPPSICPSLLEYFSVLGASGRFSHNTKASRKGGIFSD